MTSNKTPREFWIVEDPEREFMEVFDTFERAEWFKNDYPERNNWKIVRAIASRGEKVTPDEVSDGEMLQFMIDNQAMVSSDRIKNRFWCEIIKGPGVRTYDGKTPREAIIEAMREEKGRL